MSTSTKTKPASITLGDEEDIVEMAPDAEHELFLDAVDSMPPDTEQPVAVESNFYLLVCGGRDFKDGKAVRRILEGYLDTHGAALRIVEGGATGADQHAAKWAKARGVRTRRFAADWSANGKQAGVIRNGEMAAYLLWCVERGHTAHVLAFPTGGPGTKHMMEHAKSVGLTVGVVRPVEA